MTRRVLRSSNVKKVVLSAEDDAEQQAADQQMAAMQTALKVKDEERWAKEMKVWFADDNTVALRSVKYGFIKAGYFDHGAKEVYLRVGKNNRVIFAAKYPFESVKGLKECDSDHVTKKMMDVPDANEQALGIRFRDQLNGILSAVRADEIVRPEVQLVFASPKCRNAAFGYAKRLGRITHPLTPTSSITIEQVKAGTVLSTALAEKHGLDPYVFRITAAAAAARLLRDYHSLPKWFTDEPAFIEGYIVMNHESVFAPGGRGRNKDNLNLVAMRGHPELFTEEGFANVSRSRDDLIVSTPDQLNVLSKASAISPSIIYEHPKYLLNTNMQGPVPPALNESTWSLHTGPDVQLAPAGKQNYNKKLGQVDPRPKAQQQYGLTYVQYTLTINAWWKYFCGENLPMKIPYTSFTLDWYKESQVPGTTKDQKAMTKKLRAARDALAMYSGWQVVRMVWDEGMIPAANSGDMELLTQYLTALRVMVAGHKPDVLIANKRNKFQPTKEVKAFMGMD